MAPVNLFISNKPIDIHVQSGKNNAHLQAVYESEYDNSLQGDMFTIKARKCPSVNGE